MIHNKLLIATVDIITEQSKKEEEEAVGIRGSLALWFQNCLQNRK